MPIGNIVVVLICKLSVAIQTGGLIVAMPTSGLIVAMPTGDLIVAMITCGLLVAIYILMVSLYAGAGGRGQEHAVQQARVRDGQHHAQSGRNLGKYSVISKCLYMYLYTVVKRKQ